MSIETFVEILKSYASPDYSLERLLEDRSAMVEESEDLTAIDSMIEVLKSKAPNLDSFYFFGLEDFDDETTGFTSNLSDYISSFGLEDLHQFFSSFLNYNPTGLNVESEDLKISVNSYSGDGILVVVHSHSDNGGSFDEIIVSLDN
jgi:hypothetical protein